MHSVKLKQIGFFWLLLLSINTATAQQFTQKATDYNIDLDGKKDGGFAFGDLNNDGFLDLIVNTAQDDEAHRTRIYFFDAATNKFVDVTAEKCIGCISEKEGSNITERSLVIADFNNDGYKDFVKNNSKRLDVYLNNGSDNGFTFGNGQNPNFFLYTENLTDSDPPNGIPNGMNTEGLGVLDYDNDGLLDLFIENHNWGLEIYRNTGNDNNIFEYVSPEVTGLPAGVDAEDNINDGTRVSGDYAAVTDYDNDGYIDIVARKSNGITHDIMRRDPQGTGFTDGQDLQDAFNLNKGGVAFHDFDNDGDFDLIWTEAERTVLYEQTSSGFEEVLPVNSGIDVSTANFIDGVAAGDIDNDGDIDIFLADSLGTGFLFINQLNSRDGVNTGQAMSFVQDNLGIDLQADGEGCVFTDFDQDGDLDLYINIKDGTNQYWENNFADNGSADFLKVNVFEDRPNAARYALGATIVLKDICGDLISGIREVNGGSGHGTQDPSEVHFALPGLTQQQYVLSVQYPVYNGVRTNVEILIDQGVKSIDVFPDMESVNFSTVNFNLNNDVLEINGEETTLDLLSNDELIFCPEKNIKLLSDSDFGATDFTSEGVLTFSVLDTTAAFTDTLSYEVQCVTCDSKTDTAQVIISFDPENDTIPDDCPEIVLVNPVFKTKACLLPLEAQINVPSCESIEISIESDVQNGTFTLLDNTGNFSYTLTDDTFIGTDSLTYTVLCKNGNCEKAATTTIYIQVLPEDATLSLTDDTSDDIGIFNICAGNEFVFDVISNDTIVDCVSTIFSIISQPLNGSAEISETGEVTYNLTTADFVGKDTLSYSVTCESCENLTDTTQVVIDIIKETGKLSLTDDTSENGDIGVLNTCVTTELMFDVTSNDTIVDCATTVFSIIDQPSNGTASINEMGEVTYNLTTADFIGKDTLSYAVTCESCETLTDTALVVIDIIKETGKLSLTDDTSENGDIGVLNTCVATELMFDATTNDTIVGCASTIFSIIAQPSNGTASISESGEVTYSLTATDFVGKDTLSYAVTCESCETLTDTALVVIDIIKETGKLSLTDDTSENGDIGVLNTCVATELMFDVTANDTIIDCATTVFSIIDQPSNGTASINEMGEVTYNLTTADFIGKDTLSYAVTCESCETLTDTAQVILNIVDGSAPIVLQDINLSTSCETDEVLTVSLGLEVILLQCDSSAISIIQQPVAGEIEIDENGIFSYNLLSDTFSGIDTITYQFYCESCETQQVSSSVFVEVTCDEICEDISVDNETFKLEACGNLLNDALTEVIGCNSVTYAVVTPPTKGSFIFNGNDGSFTYELSDLEFNNIDSVIYEVTCEKDCGSKSTTATIYFDLTNNSIQAPVITKFITPNGDNFNEFLRINNIECYPNHVFKVFNRWGVLIFETNDYENTPEKGWSGQVNKNTGIASGSFVPDGTYFCILEFGNGNEISEYVEIRGSNR